MAIKHRKSCTAIMKTEKTDDSEQIEMSVFNVSEPQPRNDTKMDDEISPDHGQQVTQQNTLPAGENLLNDPHVPASKDIDVTDNQRSNEALRREEGNGQRDQDYVTHSSNVNNDCVKEQLRSEITMRLKFYL